MSTAPKAKNSGQGLKRAVEYDKTPLVILDPGHGGLINGEYQTKGKRSPEWPDGSILYEGEFNRAIVDRLKALLIKSGVPCVDIVNTPEDMPLEERTRRANDLFYKDKNCFLVSIHANAGGGTGLEVFTSPGETSADPMAEKVIERMVEEFPELRLRADKKDGDNDKEAKFWMVVQTVMPAFLVECAFMDTLEPDCKLLMSEEGRDRFALSIWRGIMDIVEEY